MGTLRSPLILFIFFVLIQIGFVIWFYYKIVEPQVIKLDSAQVEQNLSRDLNLIQHSLFELERLSKMFSQLPAIQSLIRSKPNSSLTEQLERTMINYEINFIAVINQNEQVIFEKTMDLNTETPYPNLDLTSRIWDTRPNFFKHVTQHNIYSGLLNSPLGPLFIVSLPIVATDVNSMNSLIVGKIITNEVLNSLRTMSYDNFKLWPTNTFSKNNEHSSIVNNLFENGLDQLITSSNDTISGFTILRDINEEPSFILNSTLNRNYKDVAFSTLFEPCLYLIVSEMLFIFALCFIMQKMNIVPLYQLTQDLENPRYEFKTGQIESKPNKIDLLRSAIAQRLTREKENVASQSQLGQAFTFNKVNQYYIEQLEIIIHAIQDEISHIEEQLSQLPINDIVWIIATYKSAGFSKDTINSEMQKLITVNEQLTLFQNELRNNIYDLHDKLLRNVASLKLQIRSNLTWKEFTPFSNVTS